MSSYYLTAAIPYVNAKPHLGHVLEWFQADAMARFQRLQGHDVAFTCGTDENSLKNVRAAEKAGVTTQDWLDQYAQVFHQAFHTFDISITHFRRSSDADKHYPGVQDLWRRCADADDLYKKSYEGLYCVGCEAFYTPDELIDGKCPEHLTAPETIVEENYFFRLSKYQDQLEKLISSDNVHIISDQYKQEMLGFIRQGLTDFSVSRSTSRARGVGVPVPDDETQVMYVWFDALAVYLTAIGWGFDQASFEKYWPAAAHVIGKGINRFHSVYWIGMLLSAGLPLPKVISVHGYLTADRQKMSKSLGNVIDPFELVEHYGVEPVRYYLLKEISTHGDGDFTYDKLAEVYTADLANGIGNLCSRVAKLCENHGGPWSDSAVTWNPEYVDHFTNWNLDLAAKYVQNLIAETDGYLSDKKPWTLTGDAQKVVLQTAKDSIVSIAYHLQPFLPKTAEKILAHFRQQQIVALSPLFPRLT